MVRGTGERAGITTGRAGIWVYAHRLALRIAAVVGACLIFVFWTDPTGLVVLLIAIVLAIVLGLIELVARPSGHAPSRPQPARPD
jgi:hypothetical protein